MEQRGLERYAPLAGVVFLVLIIVSIVLAGEAPDPKKDSTGEVVAYWADNDTENMIAAAISALAAVALVWFAGSLRGVLVEAEGGTGRLAALAFAGLVIAAAGAGVNSSLQFAAAESANEVPAEVTQALSTAYVYFWFPFTIGFALTMFGTGLAALRFGVLPTWLAWVSIVIGIVLLTPAGFFGFLLTLLWVVVVSVMLFLRDRPTAPPTAATPAAAPEAPPPV